MASDPAAASFLPTLRFSGAKAGYYFGTGLHGTGYYVDEQQRSTLSAHNHENDNVEEAGASQPRRKTGEELLKDAEDAAGNVGLQLVDAKVLKKLVNNLQRKYQYNLEQRAKHADEPSRFIDSELDLDEAIKSLTSIAAAPELYPDLVASGAITVILSLLHHENGDIAADTIELISELTDADAIEHSETEAAALVEALLAGGLLESLASRLAALNESNAEEASAVYNALSVVENAVDVLPDAASVAAGCPGLLEWMLMRLRPKTEMDGNKQYAAEVLAVLLQAGGNAARDRFAQLDGVEKALQAVAPYRSRGPQGSEEEEFVENVFDALCAVLMDHKAKAAFVEAEGVELLALILKAKTAASMAAAKCLDFATTRCPAACDRAVDHGVLRTVFALLMGKMKFKAHVDDSSRSEAEERSVSVIANLLTGVTTAKRRERVAAKFVENEYEKCDRLFEIFFRYEGRVVAEEERLAVEGQGSDREVLLLARLDAGLFTMQQCALVAGELWALGDVGIRKRVLALLHQRSRALSTLRFALLELRAMLGGEEAGEESEKEERQKRVDRVTRLLAALGHKEEEAIVEEIGREVAVAARSDDDKAVVGSKRGREGEEQRGDGVQDHGDSNGSKQQRTE